MYTTDVDNNWRTLCKMKSTRENEVTNISVDTSQITIDRHITGSRKNKWTDGQQRLHVGS